MQDDLIVTIDGPAGSGKSTAARKLAARLEIAYLDTGAMYRAIAYQAARRGADFHDTAALLEVARTIDMDLDCGPTHTRVRVGGHDVSEAIRTMEVSRLTSPVARTQAIRDLLVAQQQRIGRQLRSFVTEGRDQGSVVFPRARVKFVLDASLACRAARRHRELLAEGEDASLEEVLESLRRRDENDCRQWAPLLRPGAAVLVDTTTMTLHDVVEHLLQEVLRIVGAEPASHDVLPSGGAMDRAAAG
jgi:cytidylate kinase